MKTFLRYGLTLCLFLPSLWAQRDVRPGTMEMNLYTGGTFDLPGAGSFVGISQANNPGNSRQQFSGGRKVQPLVGGSYLLALHRALWIYGDYSYVFKDKTASSVVLNASSAAETVNRHYWTSGAGIQLSFPTAQRVLPYLELGGIYLHQSYNRTSRYTNVSTTPFLVRDSSEGIWGAHLGGGVRVFTGEAQGFRFGVDGFYLAKGIEQRVPGITALDVNPSPTFPVITRRGWGRITVGYFWQFGRR